MSALSRKHLQATLADGRILDLHTVVADQIAYEQTRHRRKWPLISEGGVVMWWTFLAWTAATRLGDYDDTYDAWQLQLVDVDDLDTDDDDDAATVDPTSRAASPI